MSGPENTFIASVHRHLQPKAPYRMKNHNVYNAGIADVWYSGMAADLWIEYKFIKVPVRDSTVIDLISGPKPEISVLQQDWLRSRHAEGRNVGIIVGSKDGGVWLEGISWDRKMTAKEFRSMIVPRNALAKIIESLTEMQ